MDREDLASLQELARAKRNEVHRPNRGFADVPNVKQAVQSFDDCFARIDQASSLEECGGDDTMKELIALAENVDIAIEGAKFDNEDLVMLVKQAKKMSQAVHQQASEAAGSAGGQDALKALVQEFDQMYDQFTRTEATKDLDKTKDDFHELNVSRNKITHQLQQQKHPQQQQPMSQEAGGAMPTKTEHLAGSAAEASSSGTSFGEEIKMEE